MKTETFSYIPKIKSYRKRWQKQDTNYIHMNTL